MYEASLAEVLRVVLIILLIYFGFKILIRFFGPLLLRYILKKAGKHFEKKFGNFHTGPTEKKKREGEVSIDKKPKQRRKSKKNDVGEYIDYEELD
ncbi:MAG TPA: DUF4834 family protein [Salinimicrobium sp.]|nr:DUF4834 family protein [Salinimicrobium sp.]